MKKKLAVLLCLVAGLQTSAQCPFPVVAIINPLSASLNTSTTQLFIATVTGTKNKAVTWAVNSISGGNSIVGTVDATGLYTAPASVPSPATVSVTATSNADHTKTATAAVTILSGSSPPPPTVLSVSPSSGPTAGGTAVTITGTNFRSGASVQFGSSSATSVVVVNGTTITCNTPSGSAGPANVTVVNSDSTSGTLNNGYTYQSTTADYYIDPVAGNDANSGTIGSPFKTISHAQTIVDANLNCGTRTQPLVVMLRGGVYKLSAEANHPLLFTSSDSGCSSSHNVIWQNYPGETPVIDAGLTVGSWTNTSGNNWQATLPGGALYFEDLYYNGVRRMRPRLGSSNLGSFCKISAAVGSNHDRFVYNPSDPCGSILAWANLAPAAGNQCGQTPGNSNLQGEIEVYIAEKAGDTWLRVSCIDTSTHTLYFMPNSGTRDPIVAGHRYMVENVTDVFTRAGQWYLDRSSGSPWTLKYKAQAGENPNTDTVVIPQYSQILVAQGLQHVTFLGITWEHDNYPIANGQAGYPYGGATGNTYSRLDNGNPGPPIAPAITGAVSLQGTQDVHFKSNTITQIAGEGIEFLSCADARLSVKCPSHNAAWISSGNSFEDGAIYDIGASPVVVGVLANPTFDTDSTIAQSNTVKNSILAGYGHRFTKSFGIAQAMAASNLYTHNKIYDSYGGGIDIGADNNPPPTGTVGSSGAHGVHDNVVSFNDISNIGQGLSNDMACVYFNTSAPTWVPTGNQGLNNKCHDVNDSSAMGDADGFGGAGNYIDNNSGFIDLENNLVYRVSGNAVSETCGPPFASMANTIKNNIYAWPRLSVKQQGCVPTANNILQFNFQKNIVYFGSTAKIQAGCASCLGGSCTTNLPGMQGFDHNLYAYGANVSAGLPANPFSTGNDALGTATGCTRPNSYASLAAWQSGTSEDSGSINSDPLFTQPYSPADDYSMLPASPASTVGFTSFLTSGTCSTCPGRTSPLIPEPTVAATFPTATFSASSYEPTTFSITTAFSGTGGGSVSGNIGGIQGCTTNCSSKFISGATLILTATANVNSTFTSWSGCDSVVANVCTVTVTASKTVSVVFTSSGGSSGGNPGTPPTITGTAYWMAPTGSDSNPCTSGSPCKTLQTYANKLKPGDGLILKNGTYTGSNSGYLNVDCSGKDVNGTSTKPIIIEAQNEGQAFINNDGSTGQPVAIQNCQYWTNWGLHIENGDYSQYSSNCDVVLVYNSQHISWIRNDFANSNKYCNSHLIDAYHSDYNTIIENGFYYYHRHGILFEFSGWNIVQRNYFNSRDKAGTGGGSTFPTRGDTAWSCYPCHDSKFINNVIEDVAESGDIQCAYITDGCPNNQFYGNVSNNAYYGIVIKARPIVYSGICTTDGCMPHNTYVENHVTIAPSGADNSLGFFGRSSKNTQCNNCSVFSNSNTVIGFNFDPGGTGSGDGQGDGNASMFGVNILTVGASAGDGQLANIPTWSIDYIRAFSNGTNFSPSVPNSHVTHSSTTDPTMSGCYLFVPATASVHNAGKGGAWPSGASAADIGANDLYAYEVSSAGVVSLTTEKLWDSSKTPPQFLGQGATITVGHGANNVAGQSLFDVGTRLHLNAGGCSLPAGY